MLWKICTECRIGICDIKCINLNNKSIKILYTHHSSCNKIILLKKFLKVKSNRSKVLQNCWRTRQLKVGLHYSRPMQLKKIQLASITCIPKTTTEQLNYIQKKFIRQCKQPKIKHSNLINSYKSVCFKQTVSLQIF